MLDIKRKNQIGFLAYSKEIILAPGFEAKKGASLYIKSETY